MTIAQNETAAKHTAEPDDHMTNTDYRIDDERHAEIVADREEEIEALIGMARIEATDTYEEIRSLERHVQRLKHLAESLRGRVRVLEDKAGSVNRLFAPNDKCEKCNGVGSIGDLCCPVCDGTGEAVVA